MKIMNTNGILMLLAAGLVVTGSVLGFSQFVAENRADEDDAVVAEFDPTDVQTTGEESEADLREQELAEQQRLLDNGLRQWKHAKL